MKVLLTTHQYFPDFSAGTEVLTRSVARELLARGHQVHIFTGHPSTIDLHDDDRLDEYDLDGVHIYRFHHAYTPMAGQTSSIALGFDNQLAAQLFGEVLLRFQPDVVHFFHLNRLGTGLIDQAVAAKVPAFLTPTDFWLVCPTAKLSLPNGRPCAGPTAHAGNCVKHFAQSAQAVQGSAVAQALASFVPVTVVDGLVRLSLAGRLPAYAHQHEVHALSGRLGANVQRLNTLHRIVAPNHFMADLLKRHGVQPAKLVESAYGIDAVPLALPRPVRRPGTALRVAYIGTLGEHKGCHVLIDAFQSLPAHNANLQIYGSEHDFPGYAASLRARAHSQSNIAFCGVFDNTHIATVLSQVDVLVVPSLWFENTPLVVYSAQASHVVVVGSDFPGLAAAVTHDDNGLLFDPGNAQALAAALLRLCHEPGLLESLHNRCRPPKTTAHYVDDLLRIWDQA